MKAIHYMKALADAARASDVDAIDEAVTIIRKAVDTGKTVFTCGNGGSASTASHFVTDWAKMRLINRGVGFKAFCLSDNIGMLTAYANDLSYDNVFDHSLKNYAKPGDVLILISGSGNSQNVINAARMASKLNVTSIAIVGFDGGKLRSICDHCVHYKVNDMQLAEDLHLSFGHIVMRALC
ncbi:SIS domain-containing protein [Amylibacter sp.]|nr:SIS domain-containing protein [Amylibacter sp.]